jgi:DNA-directed RNA polymerase subunit L/DNA-directed RNA polymerase alpha subunit
MQFQNFQQVDPRTCTFKLTGSHVTYANTIRRLILTGVETVAFRSDMTSTGTTTDVSVAQNDTPMTNEMLADRIGLLPIDVKDPISWNSDKYRFTLKVEGDKERVRHVKSSDFEVTVVSQVESDASSSETVQVESYKVPTEQFFPRNPITNDTCLIASLQPSIGTKPQAVEIIAKASVGTGREHARFCPVSQCTYEYAPDDNSQRIQEMFIKWCNVAKKVSGLDKASARYEELWREFQTMQIKRCFKVDDKGEPYEFDFTVESVGVLDVPYIVNRACEVGRQICIRYSNLDKGKLPNEVTIAPADSRVVGFDFVFREQDHTLGNLLQTWLVQHHIEGDAQPTITYAGYSVPHPLRDEMVLRIGVKNGDEAVARAAVAAACKGCIAMFEGLIEKWNAITNRVARVPLSSTSSARPAARKPRLGAPAAPAPSKADTEEPYEKKIDE